MAGCLRWPILAEIPLGRILSRILPIISFSVHMELKVMISSGSGTLIGALLTLWRAQFLLIIRMFGLMVVLLLMISLAVLVVLGFMRMRLGLGGSIGAADTLIFCLEMVTWE